MNIRYYLLFIGIACVIPPCLAQAPSLGVNRFPDSTLGLGISTETIVFCDGNTTFGGGLLYRMLGKENNGLFYNGALIEIGGNFYSSAASPAVWYTVFEFLSYIQWYWNWHFDTGAGVLGKEDELNYYINTGTGYEFNIWRDLMLSAGIRYNYFLTDDEQHWFKPLFYKKSYCSIYLTSVYYF